MTPKEAALARLRIALPHLREAVAVGKHDHPEEVPQLGIMTRTRGGAGHVVVTFDCADFLADLRLVIDDDKPDPTEMEVKAASLLRKFGNGIQRTLLDPT